MIGLTIDMAKEIGHDLYEPARYWSNNDDTILLIYNTFESAK